MTDYKNVDLYREIHNSDNRYGANGSKYLSSVMCFIDNFEDHEINFVLDYGCGKSSLTKELSKYYPHINFYGYDPAVEGISSLPHGISHYDLIICTNVLEHVPVTEMDSVLNEISSLSQNVIFVLNHCKAYRSLPNGENAHCTIKPVHWYVSKFDKYFKDIVVLDCAEHWRSLVLTFGIKTHVYNQYYSMLCNSFINVNK